jgi:hypothetical protein
MSRGIRENTLFSTRISPERSGFVVFAVRSVFRVFFVRGYFFTHPSKKDARNSIIRGDRGILEALIMLGNRAIQ